MLRSAPLFVSALYAYTIDAGGMWGGELWCAMPDELWQQPIQYCKLMCGARYAAEYRQYVYTVALQL